ncbi:MAG TPA: YceI family protein [Kofleriaceae bacterium]|nr:YceI family protein [Kofleriaceae bacterium]
MKYRVDAGKLTVKARSRVHDTVTTWDQITGDVDADPDTLPTAGAKASFTVDMTAFDAGDWLKNRKLRKDFQMDAHPRATFELRSVRDVVRDGPTFRANAEGVLRWRGKELVVVLAGQGKLDAVGVEATATFDLDITKLGLAAPKFLMIKMDDVVAIEVTIRGGVQA